MALESEILDGLSDYVICKLTNSDKHNLCGQVTI